MRCFLFFLVRSWLFLARICDGASLLVANAHLVLAGPIRIAIRYCQRGSWASSRVLPSLTGEFPSLESISLASACSWILVFLPDVAILTVFDSFGFTSPTGPTMTGCPSNRALDGGTDDGSLETLLTNMEKKQEDISGLESPSPPFRGMRSLSVHVLLLFLASTFFALWINTIQVPCPLDPLLTYCKPDTMHGTQHLTHCSQLR